MTGLFISLYLDEDVSAILASMIRARGFEVVTTLDAGKLGATDVEQLQFAAEREMTLLTHNRVDFERLATEYVATHKTSKRQNADTSKRRIVKIEGRRRP